MNGLLERNQVDNIVIEQPAEVCKGFVITHESVSAYIAELGVRVLEDREKLETDDLVALVTSVSQILVLVLNEIYQSFPQNDRAAPPVTMRCLLYFRTNLSIWKSGSWRG